MSWLMTQEQAAANARNFTIRAYDNMVVWRPLDPLKSGYDTSKTADGRVIEYDIAVSDVGNIARARLIGEEGVEKTIYRALPSGGTIDSRNLKRSMNRELAIPLRKRRAKVLESQNSELFSN